jgi:uncharacterized protein (DUF983 family)
MSTRTTDGRKIAVVRSYDELIAVGNRIRLLLPWVHLLMTFPCAVAICLQRTPSLVGAVFKLRH